VKDTIAALKLAVQVNVKTFDVIKISDTTVNSKLYKSSVKRKNTNDKFAMQDIFKLK